MEEKMFLKVPSLKIPPGEGKFLSLGWIKQLEGLLSELYCDGRKMVQTARYLLISSSSNTSTIPQPCYDIQQSRLLHTGMQNLSFKMVPKFLEETIRFLWLISVVPCPSLDYQKPAKWRLNSNLQKISRSLPSKGNKELLKKSCKLSASRI